MDIYIHVSIVSADERFEIRLAQRVLSGPFLTVNVDVVVYGCDWSCATASQGIPAVEADIVT